MYETGQKHSETAKSRVKGDWNEWMGPMGADVSAVDVGDIEVMANKLSYTMEEAGKVDTSTNYFNQLGSRQLDMFLKLENIVEYDEIFMLLTIILDVDILNIFPLVCLGLQAKNILVYSRAMKHPAYPEGNSFKLIVGACVLGLARTGLIFTRIEEGTQLGGLTQPGQTEKHIPCHVPSCRVPVGGGGGVPI